MTPEATKKQQTRVDRPFPWLCANCLHEEVHPATFAYPAKVKHDGREYEIAIPEFTVPKCRNCGQLVFSVHADEQVSRALRSHLRLLTPEQIRSGRKALRLKAKELASWLGVAAATLSRWESGALIQSRAMDNFLRAYFALPELRAVLLGLKQDPNLGARVVWSRSCRRRRPG
jgi:putative zinc finger/helix-turn-helix YgiT family protein